jgi:sarcosine oxidase subunit beta
MTPASVVIVGGGVIGVSIAFHLAEAGVEDVVLVERGEPGSGSSSKGAGGVRARRTFSSSEKSASRSSMCPHSPPAGPSGASRL